MIQFKNHNNDLQYKILHINDDWGADLSGQYNIPRLLRVFSLSHIGFVT